VQALATAPRGALANSANSSIEARLNQMRNSPEELVALWGQSGGVPLMHYIQNEAAYVKKLRRGKAIPEIEAVWNNYVSVTRHRQRHIRGYATRMRLERLTNSGCQMERRTGVVAVGHHTEVFQNSGFEHFDVGNFGFAFWA